MYHNTLPNFSISSSPPQQSPMFMDQNTAIYGENYNSYGANNMIRSRSLQCGPNTLRPSNLPPLRRSASATSQNRENVQYLKTSRGDMNTSSHHVLTPFDYPLSNPTINNASDNNGSMG